MTAWPIFHHDTPTKNCRSLLNKTGAIDKGVFAERYSRERLTKLLK
jgi:hypothetical protein